jgi:hypothetical protein
MCIEVVFFLFFFLFEARRGEVRYILCYTYVYVYVYVYVCVYKDAISCCTCFLASLASLTERENE